MKESMSAWIEGIVQNSSRVAVPVLTFPVLKELDKTVEEAVKDGSVHAQMIQAVVERYPVAAAVMAMDLSVEAEAFGSTVSFSEWEVPAVTDRMVQDFQAVKNLQVPTLSAGRLPQVIYAADQLVKNVTDRPVLAGMCGPFTLATRLYGMTEMMMALVLEPKTVHLLLEKSVAFLKEYARNLKGAGCQGVFIAEPAAGLLSLAHCQEFSSLYVQSIVEGVQDDNFSVILHNCGNTVHLANSMVSTGAKGLHFGNQVDILKILPQIPSDRLVMGNLDPAGVMRSGAPEMVEQATAELLDKTRNYPNFVLSSGCDIPYDTPEANIRAFFAGLAKYNSSL